MDSYLFSRPYYCSFIDNIDISPYHWLKTVNNEVRGIWIDIQHHMYNKDNMIVQGYKIEKSLREVYKNNYNEDGE